MYEMDQLKAGIGLRAYGQRDPLVEYKREAFRFFETLIRTIDRDIVGMVYKLQINMPEKSRDERRKESGRSIVASHQETAGMGIASASSGAHEPNPNAEASKRGKAQPFKRTDKKVGRNDPCPCGSGKKYKKCCGRDA